MSYIPRVIDAQLQRALTGLPAIAIEGAKGIGKSSSAERQANTVFKLDNPAQLEALRAQRELISEVATPVLIDEWQYDREIWDVVRRSVDADRTPGQFILTGSANPKDTRIHSGAGRITRIRMRPLSFYERQLETPTVSLSKLLNGTHKAVHGETQIKFADYVSEILASGLPGIRAGHPDFRNEELDSYLDFAISHEVPALGTMIRRPVALLQWLRAYAAATSSTASFEAISDAVSKSDRQPRSTIIDYREALSQLWLLDEVPPWEAGNNHLSQLGKAPKHQLADPAFAARLLRLDLNNLLQGKLPPGIPQLQSNTLLGKLFESLVTLSLRVYAAPTRGEVSHLRTHRGDHEIDLIIESPDGHIVAVEVKLAPTVDDSDVRHLNWLQRQIGEQLVDRIVITTGPFAYRREDGVAVVPLALLGP